MRVRAVVPPMAVLLGVALLPAVAGAAIRTVAVTGDPAPGTGGGTFVLPSWISIDPVKPAISETGRVAFRSAVDGGAADSGIFLDEDGALTALAVEGGSAPPPAGGSFRFLLPPVIDAAGDRVAFGASLMGGAASAGLFVASGGTITSRVLSGDVAPGTGGGTFVAFGAGGLDAAGHVAFNASVSGGTASGGTFSVSTAGAITPIAVVGDAAPGAGGATYTGIDWLQGNDAGEIVFRASLSTGSGVFLASGGGVAPVALSGATAPGTGGGSYFSPSRPSLADDGGVAFAAFVAGGSTFEGIFRDQGGAQTAAALVGDAAPGTGGGHYAFGGYFSDYAAFAPSAADGGRVAFVATVHDGGVRNGLFLAIADEDFELVVPGDYLGDRPGRSIYAVLGAPALTDSRLVVFHARLAEPGYPGGLFLRKLTTGQVLALPAPGLAILAVLLGGAARTALARRTRRQNR